MATNKEQQTVEVVEEATFEQEVMILPTVVTVTPAPFKRDEVIAAAKEKNFTLFINGRLEHSGVGVPVRIQIES
jgi:hypothetical protein